MKEPLWKNEMPKLPEDLHQTILRTLKELPEKPISASPVPVFRKTKRAILIGTLAAAMMCSTAFAATQIWDHFLADQFNRPDTEQQLWTVNHGVSDLPELSVTDNGLTVTVVQTLHDQNRLYLLLKVKAQEPVIRPNSFFATISFTTASGNSHPFHYIGGYIGETRPLTLPNGLLLSNVVPMDADDSPVTEGYYCFDCLPTSEDWQNEPVTLHLSWFSYDLSENKASQRQCIRGNWDFTLCFQDVSYLTKTLSVPEPLPWKNGTFIHAVSVSPVSVRIVCDNPDLTGPEQNEEDFFPITFVYRNGETCTTVPLGITSHKEGQLREVLYDPYTVINTEELQEIILGDTLHLPIE